MFCEPCEPYLDLPKILTLESIKNSNECMAQELKRNSTKAEKIFDKNVKHKISYIQKEYKLLPIFKDQFEHLNEVLSVKHNEYLKQRWNNFLDDVPETYTRISLYMDYKKELEVRVVRRKTLNGKFYGEDNKLAPIPQLSNPRISGAIGNKQKSSFNRNNKKTRQVLI